MTLRVTSRPAFLAIVIALCVLILAFVAKGTDTVYPTPETQSAFLKSYNLADVIAPFSVDGAQHGAPGGSSAGHGCASHYQEFQSFFAIASGNGPTVIAAVRQDIRSRLSRDGIQIVAELGNADGGLQFDYVAGKGKGSVTVDPLKFIDPKVVAGPAGLDPGKVAVELHMRLEETWYKGSAKDCRRL